jgi:hypothetical protein
MDPAAEMEAMMKLAQPGPQHAEFALQEGIWKTSMKAYMEPGMPPMVVDGESTMKTIMGGRYLVEEFVSDFMGMPFEGMLLQGYDNLSQEYWSIWIDSTSTGYMASRGQKGADGSLVLNGTMKDLRTPEGRPVRSVVTQINEDAVHFEMFDTAPDGTEIKVMEIDYTR